MIPGNMPAVETITAKLKLSISPKVYSDSISGVIANVKKYRGSEHSSRYELGKQIDNLKKRRDILD